MPFWKKRREAKSAPKESTTPVKQVAMARKAEGLQSVIEETEPESAWSLIQGNERFMLPDGAGIILVLLVDQKGFGGFSSATAKKDEAKGSILERITADSIQVLATEDMLADNALGIIPTEQSLGDSGMNEYNLLRNATYLWARVEKIDGKLDVTPLSGRQATLADAQAIQSGSMSIDAALSRTDDTQEKSKDEAPVEKAVEQSGEPETAAEAVAESEPAPAPTPEPEATEDEEPTDLPSDDEWDAQMEQEMVEQAVADDDTEGVTDDADVEPEPGSDPEPVADDSDIPERLDDDDALLDEDDDEADYDDEDEYVVDVEEVRDNIARRFCTDELSFDVDMSPFVTVYEPQATTPFAFDAQFNPDSWLDEQVGVMAKQANSELASLRQRHIDMLKALYVERMSHSIDRLYSQLDIHGRNTFAELLDQLNGDLNAALVSLDDRADKVREKIRERYEHDKEQVMETARMEAGVRYDSRHRAERDAKLEEVPRMLQNRIQDQHDFKKQRVYELRRKEAEGLFEVLETEVLASISKRHSANLREEEELFTQWQSRMGDYIDEHRKEDVARSEALAEDLARTDAVAKVRAEADARLARLEKKHADEEEAYQEHVRNLHADFQKQLATISDSCNLQVKSLTERESQANTTVEQLRKELASVREQTKTEVSEALERKHEVELTALREDKAKLNEQLERNDASSKRALYLYIFYAFIIALAFLAVGTLLGVVLARWFAVGQAAATVVEPFAYLGQWLL